MAQPPDGAGDPPDVLVLGELVVDLVAQRGEPLAAAAAFTRVPGGPLTGLAVGVARLGRRAAFAGLVGDDPFGRYLVTALQSYGVDTSLVGFHPRGRTPVAFVTRGSLDHPLLPDGAEELLAATAEPDADRQVLYYREGGADQLLSPTWLPAAAIARASILACGGVSLASALPRAALHMAIAQAQTAGTLVAFEVNWRPGLWQYPERARTLYHDVLPQVDILKISSEELIMLTGGVAATEDGRLEAILQAWIERIVAGRTRPLLVALTRGPAGCSYGLWHPGGGFAVAHLPACDVMVKDRTGAGNAFLAGLLVALLDRLAPHAAGQTDGRGPARLDLNRLDLDTVAEIFAWANASGGLATTRHGALAALPGRNTVLRLIKGRRSG